MDIHYNELDHEACEKLDKFFLKKKGYIEMSPGKVVLPRKYSELAKTAASMPVKKDDIWLISYPRTGSTWLQELIWLLGNNLDYEGAKKVQLMRTPLLEMSAITQNVQCVTDFLTNNSENSVEYIKNMPSPRFIKTHIPLQFLPRELHTVKPKMIYIARNPKDLCVSYYHLMLKFHGMAATFKEFSELFLTNYLPGGNVSAHMLTFWELRHDSNILFLKYEDLKQNLPSVVRKCAQFMNFGRELTEDEMTKLCNYLTFDQMQKNPAVNLEPVIDVIMNDAPWYYKYGKSTVKFIRKGQIGDWKNYMDKDTSDKFDLWAKEKLTPAGLEFIYEDDSVPVEEGLLKSLVQKCLYFISENPITSWAAGLLQKSY